MPREQQDLWWQKENNESVQAETHLAKTDGGNRFKLAPGVHVMLCILNSPHKLQTLNRQRWLS